MHQFLGQWDWDLLITMLCTISVESVHYRMYVYRHKRRLPFPSVPKCVNSAKDN